MKKITVNASKKYDILIADNLLENTGDLILGVAKPQTVAIITDDIVDGLYSKTVENSLEKSNLKHIKYVIKSGEESKNGNNFLKICEFLAENQITRSDLIIALGGGVVGDLAGFVASAYLRGIDFIQIPTTLLSCVDSSVGGKTAIDIESGKNSVGAFYQPRLVICDYSTLNTLSDEVFSQGCAEVIKYAVIGNTELFSHLQKNKKDFDREYVISECVKMKRDIVQRDEFDKGDRQLLNLGHTIGHAVELKSNFEIAHGEAVAIGLCMIANASYKKGLCFEQTKNDIINIIKDFDLPVSASFSADELYKTALNDKKRTGDTIKLIIPYSIGDSRLLKIKTDEILSFIEEGIWI